MFTTEKAPGEIQNPSFREQHSELDILSRRILAAAAYIEDHGWCQGQMKDEAGQVCIGGAIYAVTGGYNPGDRENPLQWSVFAKVGAALDGSLSTWNDRARSKAEVVAKLRAVALGG